MTDLSEATFDTTRNIVDGVAAQPGERRARVEQLTARTHEAVDRLAENAGPMVERLRAGAHTATDRLGAHAERLAQMPLTVAQTSRETVRTQPLMAIALAFVAGTVAAQLLRR